MPIVEVTHGAEVSEETLRRLADLLPHAVSLAVECPEEPYDHPLEAGDVDLRFRVRGPLDTGGLDVVVEVRTKWYASRAETRQRRVDQLHRAIGGATGPCSVGVYLTLPVAAWSQTD